VLWLSTGHGSPAHTVRNIRAAPLLGQAVQEIHGLEEIACTLE
jgi:hypothetical protein